MKNLSNGALNMKNMGNAMYSNCGINGIHPLRNVQNTSLLDLR